VLGILVFLLLWKGLVVVLAINPAVLPPPEAVLRDGWAAIDALLLNSWVTIQEVVPGYLLAIVIGLALSVAMTVSPRFSRIAYPVLVGSQAVPKVAIVPLLVVWMGFGKAPIITMVVIISFFPVVISTVAGLRSVPADLLMLGRSMGLKRIKMFFKIMFPYALGSIFAGLKLAMSLAMIGAVVGEFIGGQAGLGYYILATSNAFQVSLTFAAIVVVVIISLLMFQLVVVAERLSLPARRGRVGSEQSVPQARRHGARAHT